MTSVELSAPIQILPGIGPQRATDLATVGIKTINDLLWYLPFRYIDAATLTPIAELPNHENETVTIQATVQRHQPLKTRRGQRFIITTIEDESGKLQISFFNQPYALQSLKAQESYTFTGKVSRYRGRLTLTNPTYEPANQESIHTGRIVPVYSQTSDLSMRLVRKLLYTALFKAKLRLPEYLPPQTLQEHQLMPREEAIQHVHFPENMEQAEKARERLAFDELWELFSKLDEQYQQQQKEPTAWSFQNPTTFTKQFKLWSPFDLTPSQVQACQHIAEQLTQAHPTRHVVQGEVGSGKTLVAAFALLAAAKEGQQALYLAPTTILAQQHFEVLQPVAKQAGIECTLWISHQKTPLTQKNGVVIGTHALLHAESTFQPAVIVVDEEHRFGVTQREQYWQRQPKPHLITMTATPIPRTLATVLFTDQSVSFLDLIEGKEKNITTRVVSPNKLKDHLDWLAEQVSPANKAFLISPLIQPSEAEGFEHLMDAHTLYDLACQHLPPQKVGLLTGKDTAEQKKEVLQQLQQGEIDVLVATPVIEVGIDIPEASIITITSAERFGLAQLHQLRGRVGRQGQDSWCFLLPSKPGSNVTRLRQLEATNEGWRLAELDLQERGVGEFLGTRQSGWDTLEVASWLDLDILRKVKMIYNQNNH